MRQILLLMCHPKKRCSRVAYSELYANTDVVYELISNQVKESVIIGEHDPGLRGYCYTLNVGNLVPVLTEDNQILLYDEKEETVVMTMPAPYLEDANGECCDNVTVELVGKGDTYILAYTLPQSWLADESRAYPVILDPVVAPSSEKDNIEDVSVYEQNPESYTANRLSVGRNANYGTIHYFTKSGSVYYDEDGLGLEIVVNSDGSYTMSDAMDNKWVFTDLGNSRGHFMTSSQDNDGNSYQLNYSSGKLNTIVQKNKGQDSVTVATFTYSGNQVTRITDAAGNYTAFTYNSSGKLTGLSHNTTSVAQYAYSGHRLITLTDTQRNYALHLAYTEGKVSGYHETAGGVAGVSCNITYPGFSQKTYRHCGNDREIGTSDDIYTHYLFDYSGRTVNAYTTDSTQTKVLGASNAVYTDNDGISKQNNRELRSASIGIAAQKLLTQGGFESTTDKWTYSGVSAAKTKPRTGLYSLKGTLSAATSTASASRTSMSLTKNKIYTLSAYVNTSAITSASTP